MTRAEKRQKGVCIPPHTPLHTPPIPLHTPAHPQPLQSLNRRHHRNLRLCAPQMIRRSGHFSALSPLQERAVFLKAKGQTHSAIARTLGVARNTVIGWLHLPAFAAALSELRTEAHIASREGLLAGAQDGIHGLGEIMVVMLAIVRGDAVSLSSSDVRILEAGELVRPVIDARQQIQAARVYNQLARTFMDCAAGFHPRSELHPSPAARAAGVTIDLSGEDLGDMEADLEAEMAAMEENVHRLRLLESSE